MKDAITEFSEERDCNFKGRHYSVRDNGQILRHPKEGIRPSKLDNTWTFGKKDEYSGYMLIAGIRVHQIVATAFHGIPEYPKMIVDHIDTNRCNNRPDNLRWITRLENFLDNPITRRRIELIYGGSIEDFLLNPSKLRESASEPNTKWMRAVTKEEAAICLRNLSKWATEDKEEQLKVENRGEIGDWIFNKDDEFNDTWDKDWIYRRPESDWEVHQKRIEEENRRLYEEMHGLNPSLTPGAMQLNWAVPAEFPLCPQNPSDNPLRSYLSNLKVGAIFAKTEIYESRLYKASISDSGDVLAVLSTLSGATKYALATITFNEGCFIHENIRSFFTEEGAEKYYTEALGREWAGGSVFEDFC